MTQRPEAIVDASFWVHTEQDRAVTAATGRSREDVIRARDQHDPKRAEAVFLAGCRTAAEQLGDPSLLRRAENIVDSGRGQ